ncbi:HIT family protein [Brumimicrobium aurantiacum]|uniref:HIT family protein n=1 Tax=Brumimicrobium aurantiacum TaxID=1737063 RepID=A0A3E1EYC9_9FLAO|nr:HIT family protein [Brumimicrobium aurantiacum]RFC54537.1 HIT family protein [Brumimicrobium aurantiacum]
MSTVFSKIVNGEIPAFKVAENDEFLAFLDVQPIVKGHVLVIPKKTVDYIFDIEDDLLGRFINFAKSVSKKMDLAFDCKRIGMSVIGLEVPHAHIHLMPINGIGDMDFNKDKLHLEKEEMEAIAQKIVEAK